MSYLEFNGLVIPVSARSNPGITRNERGYRDRGPTGSPRKRARKPTQIWDFETVLQNEDESKALKNFIMGWGWSWTFNEELYSGRTQLGPEPNYTAHIEPTAGLNGGAARLTSGAITLSYMVGAGVTNGRWGVLFRIKHADNSWHMYGVNDAGTEYRDGVAGSYAVIGNLLTMHASGAVEISGYNDAGAAAVLLDQLVVFPWRPTSTMFIAWTSDTAPFSPLPRLTAAGDFSPDASLEVVGQVTRGNFKTKPGNPGAHVVNFQLTEIPYVS